MDIQEWILRVKLHMIGHCEGGDQGWSGIND